MPATLVGRSAVVFGTTSATPGSVAGAAQYDMAIIYAIAKRTTAAVCQMSVNQNGWTCATMAQALVGTGAAGIGTGPQTVTMFTKEADAAGSFGTLPLVTATSGSCVGVSMSVWHPAAGERIVLGWTAGSDITAGTAFAVTGAVNLSIVTDDQIEVLAALTVGSPAVTHTSTTTSITATGATLGNTSEIYDTATANGNDEGFALFTCGCTAGSSSAAPAIATTLSATSPSGGALFVKIRSVSLATLAQENLSSNPAAATATTGYTTSGTLTSVGSLTGIPRTTGVQGTPANGGNLRSPRMAVTVGTTYVVSAYCRVLQAVSINRRLNWYNSGGGLVSSTAQVQALYNTVNIWARELEIGTAPATAATVELELSPAGTTTGVQMTCTMAEAEATTSPYGDGSFASWVWDGTTDNSTSRYSVAAPAVNPPPIRLSPVPRLRSVNW